MASVRSTHQVSWLLILSGLLLVSCKQAAAVGVSNQITLEEITTLRGHSGIISSIAFSPDGKLLASGSRDKTIKLWNVETGQEITTLTGHTSWVRTVAFSPDGKLLASGSRDKTIKMWNVETGQETATLTGHTDWVRQIAFSPDNNLLASAARDKTIKLWNVTTGKETATLAGHTDWVRSVDFSADSTVLVSASADGTIKLWNVATGQNTSTLKGPNNFEGFLAFSSDKQYFVSLSSHYEGSYDDGDTIYDIDKWYLPTGKKWYKFPVGFGKPFSLAISPDRKTLALGKDYGDIETFDLSSGKQTSSVTGHNEFAWGWWFGWAVSVVTYSPDGKILASGSNDKTIKLWKLTTVQR